MGWWAALAAALAVWWAVPSPGLGRLDPGRVPERLAGGWRRVREGLRARWPGRQGRAREAALRASVASVCDLLAVCLEAGRPPRTALRIVAGVVGGPAGEELEAVLGRIELGVDEARAWASLAAVPGYREVGRDLARSVRSGLGLAGLLRQHAVDARNALAAEAHVRARAAGVRGVVPLMLCFLPAFLLLGVVPLFGSVTLAMLG